MNVDWPAGEQVSLCSLKEVDPGQRASLGLRVTPEVKRRLEAAAEASGRSQSQEAEFRLERSFSEDEALGGPAMRRLSHLMTASFFVAGEQASLGKDGSPVEEWLLDPDCYRSAVVSLLDALVQRAPDWNTVEGKNLYFLAIKSRLATRELNENAR